MRPCRYTRSEINAWAWCSRPLLAQCTRRGATEVGSAIPIHFPDPHARLSGSADTWEYTHSYEDSNPGAVVGRDEDDANASDEGKDGDWGELQNKRQYPRAGWVREYGSEDGLMMCR